MNLYCITFFILLLITISSCETYEYGPTISFTSTKKRLERHEWTLERYEKNSTDLSQHYQTCTIKFDGNTVELNFIDTNSVAYTVSDITTYTLTEDNHRINIGGGFSNSMFIKRLDRNHFWFFFSINNAVLSYKMVPK